MIGSIIEIMEMLCRRASLTVVLLIEKIIRDSYDYVVYLHEDGNGTLVDDPVTF